MTTGESVPSADNTKIASPSGKGGLIAELSRKLFIGIFALPFICLAVVGLSIVAANTEIITPRLGKLISGAAGDLAILSGIIIAAGSLAVALATGAGHSDKPIKQADSLEP